MQPSSIPATYFPFDFSVSKKSRWKVHYAQSDTQSVAVSPSSSPGAHYNIELKHRDSKVRSASNCRTTRRCQNQRRRVTNTHNSRTYMLLGILTLCIVMKTEVVVLGHPGTDDNTLIAPNDFHGFFMKNRHKSSYNASGNFA